jgi:hypothetical protein
MDSLFDIINSFRIEGSAVFCERYGKGHINDTYLAATDTGLRYILQRINHRIFKDVPALMNNIVGVTLYILRRLQLSGSPTDRALRVIPTRNGENFLFAEGNYYRMYNFIEDAVSIEIPSHPHLMYLSGKGYGNFQKLLDGYPAEALKESIPDFHNTEKRLEKFVAALEKDIVGRASLVKEEVQFYLSRSAYASRIQNRIRAGEIPLRVTHNDTKLNNVLIDVSKDTAAAVIDLDTVMPGSIVYDFGDCIRSGANAGAEDEKDLSKVSFSVGMFSAFAEGFLEEVGAVLTEAEIEEMAFGAILMTYECGMRFLTDYLEGDIYFKTCRDGHNLDRTRTQIKMVREMENRLSELNGIVRNYAAKN